MHLSHFASKYFLKRLLIIVGFDNERSPSQTVNRSVEKKSKAVKPFGNVDLRSLSPEQVAIIILALCRVLHVTQIWNNINS